MKRSLKTLITLAVWAFVAHNAHAAGSAGTAPSAAASDHLTAIESYQQEAADITADIDKFNSFIAAAEKKPYRDSKGMKRAHWRLLVGKRQRELGTAQERIAWHTTELERLQASGQSVDVQGEFDQS